MIIRHRILTAAFVLVTLLGLAPREASAQASAFGIPETIEHQVGISNCCGHFAHASDNAPEANIAVSGPPWALQPSIQGQYGSASASSSTQFTSASENGVSVTARVAVSSTPGPQGGLRAAASEGTGSQTHFTFTLPQRAYVRFQGVVSRAHSTVDNFGASFSLRAGSAAGPAVEGFSFQANSNSHSDLSFGGVLVGPMELPAGDYALAGFISTQVHGDAGFSGSASLEMRLALQIQAADDPVGPPAGTFGMCGNGLVGTVTVTPSSGSPYAASAGDAVYLGDVVETAPAAEACIELPDGTHLRIPGDTRVRIDDGGVKIDHGTLQVSHEVQCTTRPYRIVTAFGYIESDGCGKILIICGIGPNPDVPESTVVHVIAGTVAATPWNAPPKTTFVAPIRFRFNTGGVTDPESITQDDYDSAVCEHFPSDPACVTGEAPAITSAATTTFTAGLAGTFTVTATGGPVPTLAVSGALPTGVSFTVTDPADGTAVIAGTPAAGTAGTYPLTISAANGVSPDATQSFTLTVLAPPKRLTALSPAKLWLGQSGSNKQLKYDVKVDVLVNGTRVGGGELAGVAGGGSDFSQASLASVALTLPAPIDMPPGAELAITPSVRASCSVKQQAGNAGTARLWYNGQPVDTGNPTRRDAGTRFDATIDLVNSNYYLREAAALATTAGSSRQSLDVAVANTQACPARAYTPFGTWRMTLP